MPWAAARLTQGGRRGSGGAGTSASGAGSWGRCRVGGQAGIQSGNPECGGRSRIGRVAVQGHWRQSPGLAWAGRQPLGTLRTRRQRMRRPAHTCGGEGEAEAGKQGSGVRGSAPSRGRPLSRGASLHLPDTIQTKPPALPKHTAFCLFQNIFLIFIFINTCLLHNDSSHSEGWPSHNCTPRPTLLPLHVLLGIEPRAPHAKTSPAAKSPWLAVVIVGGLVSIVLRIKPVNTELHRHSFPLGWAVH